MSDPACVKASPGNVAVVPSTPVGFPQSGAQFRSYGSGTVDWTWELDVESRVIRVSDNVIEVLGYSAEEMIGRNSLGFSTPEETQRIQSVFREVVRSASPFCAVEQTVIHRNGSPVVIESCGMPLFNEAGVLCGFRGMSRDITRRKNDEMALRESEHLLREAQRIATLGHYTFWVSTGQWVSSEELDALFGIAPDFRRDVEGWLKILHPEERVTMQEYLLKHVITDRNRFDREYRIVRQSTGEVRWVHGRGRLEDDAASGSLLMIGTIQDITERKQTALALVESERRLRLVTESATEGVWDLNLTTNKIYFSGTCSLMLGFESGGLTDDPESWIARITAEDRALVPARLRDCIEGRCDECSLEVRMEGKDGLLRWIRLRGKVAARDSSRRATRLVGTMSDIGERRQLEEQLRQAQKLEAVGQLAGGVAHDFNNILAAMTLQLDLLAMDAGPESPLLGGLDELRKAVSRAAGLTRQLLMFSRRTIPHTQAVDLNAVVVDLLKMLSRLINENVSLVLEPSKDLPSIEADTGMVEQVVMNLVVNARDAMSEGGRLIIRTDKVEVNSSPKAEASSRHPGVYVRLQVEDTGSGMTPEVRKRLFEPFFTTKEVGRGTGLGLATIHGIVAQHNGWIDVASEEGKGSVFTVYWPAIDGQHPPRQVSGAGEKVPHGSETILLVEDELLVRRNIAACLSQLGYKVIQAANGQEAIDVYGGRKIDLLFTDVVMPGMSGIELALTLRKQNTEMRTILSSGYSNELIERGKGGDDGFIYLPKPYDLGQLARTLRECLTR